MKFLQWGIYIALDNDDYEVPADLLSDKLTSLILKELDNLKSKEKLVKLKNTDNKTARNLWQKGEIMTEEVYYHSKSKGEDIPVSEMSDLYVRRAFKKMIMKERKRNDDKEKIKVNITNAMMYLEKALEE